MIRKKKTDPVIAILAVGLVVALVVMLAALCIPKGAERADFVPPPFDKTAVTGVPEVPDDIGYSAPYQEGMGYRFAACGNVRMNGTAATVFFTNPEGNEVWLKLRVLDADGNTLGETGLIKPGEYVKTVELTRALPAGTHIKLKIMGYEPETYHSAGSAVLNTMTGGTD